MSNSFNIDVKPEIAAVAADIAAAIVTINANSSGLATTIISDLADINTAIGDSETAVIESITTQLALTDAKIDVNLVAIDIIDGIADAIKLKTDLLPQVFRGKFFSAKYLGAAGTLQDVVNVSGSGKLYKVYFYLLNATDTIEIVITLDGKALTPWTHTGDIVGHVVFPCGAVPSADDINLMEIASIANDTNLFNMEFDTSLRVQTRRSAGAADNIECDVIYSLDS